MLRCFPLNLVHRVTSAAVALHLRHGHRSQGRVLLSADASHGLCFAHSCSGTQMVVLHGTAYPLLCSIRHVLLLDGQLLFRGTPRWKDLSCCNSHLWNTRMSAHCLWSWLLWCICLPPFSMLLQRVHSPLLLMAACRLPVCFSMLRMSWHKEGVMVGLHGHLFGVASAHPPSAFLSVAII